MNAADLPAEVVTDSPRRVPLFTLRKFLADEFKPMEQVVRGLPIARGCVTALTAQPGHAKTTIANLLAQCVNLGRPFAGREVVQGSVLYMPGENPDDFAMHAEATIAELGADSAAINDVNAERHFLVSPGFLDLRDDLVSLCSRVHDTVLDVALVIVDTSAAFFTGEDEDANTQMRQHASAIRALTCLPGRPAVVVLCHPAKSAMQDSLAPRGGSAFLAEIDANMTLWKDSSDIVTLHWAKKIRGTPFEPMKFELVPHTLQHVDSFGSPIVSVAARHVPDERAEQIQGKALDDETRLLVAMARTPNGSVADLAMAGGFTDAMFKPKKSTVYRLLEKLNEQGLATKDRKGTPMLTPKGIRAAAEAR